MDMHKPRKRRNPSGKVVTILVFPPKQPITCQKSLGSSATLQVFGTHVDGQMSTEGLKGLALVLNAFTLLTLHVCFNVSQNPKEIQRTILNAPEF